MSSALGMHSGDRVIYSMDGRHGIANEFLQDGDAYVSFDDGTQAQVKWNLLYPENPALTKREGKQYQPFEEEHIQDLLDQGVKPAEIGRLLAKFLRRNRNSLMQKANVMRKSKQKRKPSTNIQISSLPKWYELGWRVHKFTKDRCTVVWKLKTDPRIPEIL